MDKTVATINDTDLCSRLDPTNYTVIVIVINCNAQLTDIIDAIATLYFVNLQFVNWYIYVMMLITVLYFVYE